MVASRCRRQRGAWRAVGVLQMTQVQVCRRSTVPLKLARAGSPPPRAMRRRRTSFRAALPNSPHLLERRIPDNSFRHSLAIHHVSGESGGGSSCLCPALHPSKSVALSLNARFVGSSRHPQFPALSRQADAGLHRMPVQAAGRNPPRSTVRRQAAECRRLRADASAGTAEATLRPLIDAADVHDAFPESTSSCS